MVYKSGLEVLIEEKIDLVTGKRIGLVTNQSGLTRDLQSNIDLLFNHPAVNLVKLFGPEHGVRGQQAAEKKIDDMIDLLTGIPIISLYGDIKKPTPQMLADLDLIIFDIQDIGLRFYTYLSTLFYLIESCGENNLPLVILDRLNPLGRRMEGNMVGESFRSFVGLYPIPQRHGMTVGELANWANEEFKLAADIKVVKVENWQGEYFDLFDLPWIPPSPNIPSFKTALIYPVTCLFEGTNLSEGRGTANPFAMIGAPWIKPHYLIDNLKQKELPAVIFRPVYFSPHSSKHAGKECGGVQVFINDRNKIKSIETGLEILESIFALYPEETAWLEPEKGRYFFDLLMGTDQVRKKMEAGQSVTEITTGWQKEREEFKLIREKYLLY